MSKDGFESNLKIILYNFLTKDERYDLVITPISKKLYTSDRKNRQERRQNKNKILSNNSQEHETQFRKLTQLQYENLKKFNLKKFKIDIRSKIQTQTQNIKMLKSIENLPPRLKKSNQNQTVSKLTPGQTRITDRASTSLNKKADCNDYLSTRLSMQYISIH